MKCWYVVQTKARQEILAEENLLRQRFQCFLPRLKKWRQIRGKRVSVEEAYFPNYLFVNVDIAKTDIAPIRSTRGVSKMVRFETLLTVPEVIINNLLQRADENYFIEDVERYTPGQVVKIEEGPFVGISAIFRAKTGQDRAYFLINMLGSQQQINMPLTMIERV